MVSRVVAYCEFDGTELPPPSEDQVVILVGYRSYASRADFHRADVCDHCLKTRNVALELVELERADRAKADAGAVTFSDRNPAADPASDAVPVILDNVPLP